MRRLAAVLGFGGLGLMLGGLPLLGAGAVLAALALTYLAEEPRGPEPDVPWEDA